jgi:enoyl-CoA hydratase/carnithine racemase
MTDYKEILYEKQRGGVLITLNRPEALNAITRPMLKELHHALDEAEADPEIRAVIITGAGRAFSSGFDQATTSGRRRDIQWAYGIQTGMSAADLMNYWSADDVKLIRIFEFSKPVIGAVRGWAMGGGCWMALYTHITIAAEDAVFAQPEVRHGSNTTFMWTLLTRRRRCASV